MIIFLFSKPKFLCINQGQFFVMGAKTLNETLNKVRSFTCPVQSPTTKSAINVSSVSPLLCDTMTPQP